MPTVTDSSLIFLLALILVPFFYFVAEPFLLRKHKFVHFCASIATGCGLIVNAANAVASVSWDSWDDLIFARLNGHFDTAHIVPYVLMISLAVAVWLWEKDIFKGVLLVVSIVFMGDSVWLAMYVPKYWIGINWATMLPTLFTTFATFIVCTVVFVLKYKPSKWLYVAYIGYLAYNLVWLLSGFHFSLLNRLTEFAPMVLAPSPWFHDFTTNAIEVVGGVLQVLMFASVALFTASPKALSVKYGVRHIPLMGENK